MLKDVVSEQLKSALREQNELRLSVFRLLATAIHNREIEKRAKAGSAAELTDEEVTQAVRSEMKKRSDAAEAYEQAGRADAAKQERAEARILQELLPEELSDEELAKLVDAGWQELGVTSERDLGKVIGWVMGKVRGRAGGDRVTKLVRAKFGGS